MAIAVGSVSNTPTLGNRTNTTITAPSGIANGDLLVAILHVGDASALPALAVTPPAGWTEVANSPSAMDESASYTVAIHVYYKVASGESGDYTFTHAAADTEGYMYRLTGADTSTPIDVTPVAIAFGFFDGQTTTFGSITPVTNGAFIICAESDWDGPGSGTVSGMTPSISVRRSGTISWIGDGTQTTAGATGAGTRANGNSSTSLPWASLVVAIRPATGSTQALSAKATARVTVKAPLALGAAALSGKITTAAKALLSGTGAAALLSLARTSVGVRADPTLQSTTTSDAVLVSATSSAFNTSTTPKAVSGVTVQNGDLIIAYAMMEISGVSLSVSTTSGSTTSWTLLADVPGTATASQSYLRSWSAIASAPGTISVAFAKSGGDTAAFGGIVKVYRNSGGVGVVQAANNGTSSGAPSISVTTTRDHSVLDFACVDWNASTGAATFTSSSGPQSQDLDVLSSGLYRAYSAHVGVGSVGSKTVGMSAPAGQRYVAVALEIFGLGAVGSLAARASFSTRGGGTFSGRSGLSANATLSVAGRSTSSGKLALAGRAVSRTAAVLAQSVSLQFQTRFFPAMRGVLTTTVNLGSSAGTAIMFKASGGATARTGLAGRVRSSSQVAGGVAGRTLLSGSAKATARAASTFSGSVVLAIQTRFLPAMRGALNGAVVPTGVALAATAAAITRARAAIAGRASLTAQTAITSQAPGRMSAIAALATRSAAHVRSAAAVTAKSALSAVGSIRAVSRGAMVGTVALAGRTASALAAAVTVPGQAVQLVARAATILKTVGASSARTTLSGRSALQTKTSMQPATLRAFLAAVTKTTTTVRAATVASAALATSGAVKIGTVARAAMSGTVGLAARTKVASTTRLARPVLPLMGRAVARASAKALLFVLAPVIPTPVNTRPGRLSRLNASLLKAFGEDFDIQPMTQAVDVNSRSQADTSRTPILDISGIWDGPTTSRTPHARGALQDDNAHNWNASYPSANFDDGLVAGVRKGDVLTRLLDGAVYEIVRVVPNGFGRTTLQLSKRKRLQ